MTTKTKKFLKKMINEDVDFGNLLAALRKADEVTQVALAQKIGVSKGLICDIEKGRRMASVELAMKIAKAMGYSKKVMVKQILDDQLHHAKADFEVKLKAVG